MENRKVVLIGLSKPNMSHRIRITKFVIDQHAVPVYPGIVEDWYKIRSLKTELENDMDELLKRVDELWIFGAVTGDMKNTISLAKRLGKNVRYFDLDTFKEYTDIKR
ncbi:MAG: hypothetical protein QXP39_01860 [Candidatus Aenigmatarchaeota archaeon]